MPGADSWPRELWAKASLIDAMTIRVAATLRIADYIEAGQRSASELAATVDANPDVLERILRHLVTLDILRIDDFGHFSLTDLGDYLRGDTPNGMRPWLDLNGPFGSADLSLIHLLHTVRTGEPTFPEQFGESFWEHMSGNHDHAAQLDAMLGSSPFEADLVARSYDWGRLGHIVDVGGGNGSLLIALLREHANLTGTLIELPGPAQRGWQNLRTAGLADRADVVTGSFFDPLPSGAGGYILSAIIHDWTDEIAHKILRRCAEAAHPAGKILAVEAIDGEGGKSSFTEMDLRMLAYMGGRERTVDQLTSLAASAGLTVLSVRRVGYRSVIEMSSQ